MAHIPGIRKIPEQTKKPWQLQWYDSDGKRRTESFKTQGEARRKKLALGHKMQNEGIRIVPSREKFGEVATEWLAQVEKDPDLKPSTRRLWVSHLNKHVLPYFREREIQSVTRQCVEDFAKDKRGDGLSRSTVKTLLLIVRSVFERAVGRRTVQANPAAGLRIKNAKKRGGPKQKKTPLDTEQKVAMFARTAWEQFQPPSPWGAFFVMTIYSGLREGECLALRWCDVEWEGKEPQIRICQSWDRAGEAVEPKSESGYRAIPLFPEVRRALKEWRLSANQKEPEGRIFPYAASSYRDSLEKVLLKAKLPTITHRTLRNTFISLCANRGVPPKKLQTWAGHSDIRMTLDYYADNFGNDAEVVEKYLTGIGGA